jgi:hypothetical protein
VAKKLKGAAERLKSFMVAFDCVRQWSRKSQSAHLIREQQLRGFIVECAVVDEQFDPELAFICFLKGNLPFGSIPAVRLEL